MSIAALSNRLATFQSKTVTPDALGLGHAEAFSDTYIAKIALQPARVGFGTGQADVNVNRDE